MKHEKLIIPNEVSTVVQKLQEAGYEGYPVGGSVRDILRGAKPKDWDVATSAKPEEIQKLFPESFYENKFLTVTVKTAALGEPRPEGRDSEYPLLKEIEVTTFREEGKYTDKRHPDEVRFAKTLEEDLSRRDFTVNAMALDLEFRISNLEYGIDSKFQIPNSKFQLIDPFGGQEDLQKKIIRAVGDPTRRFEEDALRMMRAARLAIELEFTIEEKTREAIKKLAGTIE